jgi:hypothetical protein
LAQVSTSLFAGSCAMGLRIQVLQVAVTTTPQMTPRDPPCIRTLRYRSIHESALLFNIIRDTYPPSPCTYRAFTKPTRLILASSIVRSVRSVLCNCAIQFSHAKCKN